MHTLSSNIVYAVEASGLPLVAFQALSPHAVLEDTRFLEELREIVAKGQHVWDGKTPLQIRPATELEILTYHEWADEAFGFHLAYLIPLDDIPG